MSTAARNFDRAQALQKKLKVIQGSFAPNGRLDLSSSSVKGKGFTVARTGGGLYTVTVASPMYKLVAATHSLQLGTADDKFLQFQGAIDPWTTRKAIIAVWDKSSADTAEVQTVQCVADVAGSLNNKYFLLYSAHDLTAYYVWFNVNSAGVDPALSGKTGIPVAVATGASANTVAAAVNTAIGAIVADFSASVSTDTVTVTNANVGPCTAAVDGAAAPGFTYAVTTPGDAHVQDIAANSANRIHFMLFLSDSTL